MAEGTVNQSEKMVHPAVKPLTELLGTWKGDGEGFFPTISSFNYSEELQFSHSPNKVSLRFISIQNLNSMSLNYNFKIMGSNIILSNSPF